MHWQDIILGLVAIGLIASMIPTVFSEKKPPILTSIMNTAFLALFTGIYASLHFWFATATAGFTTAIWCLIAIQTYMQKDHPQMRLLLMHLHKGRRH